MARIRTIKPDFFKDEELADLTPYHRLLFIGLWTQADKAGRLEDRPRRLKAEIFPYEDVDVDQLLDDLATPREPKGKSFIIQYTVDSQAYIQISNFSKHQRPHHTEVDSILPAPHGEITVLPPLINGEVPDGREGKGKEYGNEIGREGKGVSAPASPTLPNRTASITLEDITKFKKEYPTLNIDEELENCRIYWLNEVKPAKRDPPNIRKFRNWLKKAKQFQEERDNGRAPTPNRQREAGTTRPLAGAGSLPPVDWGITSDEVE